MECSVFLENDLTGELATSVTEVGNGKTDGSTRRGVGQQREGLRHEVVKKALQTQTDRGASPVTVYQN